MAAKKRKPKYDKKRNWAKLKAEYCTTNISMRELAKKHNVPYSTINSRAMREKWTAQREECLKDIDAEVEAQILEKYKNKEIDRKVKTNELHTELYDKGLDVAARLLDNYMRDLIAGKKRTGATAANLDYLMGAIQKAQKGQRMSLNIDNADVAEVEPEVKIISGIDMNDI
ncbi:TPA: hypothetical protein CPT89_01085 [Candidatus Gastranaerophilales bacterium HUM_11]|nr:MAG TPA: hypothetical protein CPT89_01085 [Candidatus Gastranaerophilales bacterium HUM_11]